MLAPRRRRVLVLDLATDPDVAPRTLPSLLSRALFSAEDPPPAFEVTLAPSRPAQEPSSPLRKTVEALLFGTPRVEGSGGGVPLLDVALVVDNEHAVAHQWEWLKPCLACARRDLCAEVGGHPGRGTLCQWPVRTDKPVWGGVDGADPRVRRRSR